MIWRLLDHGHSRFSWLRRCLGFGSILLLAGCITGPLLHPVIGPDYQVSNVFRASDVLPTSLHRVAVLPLSTTELDPDMVAGQASLESVLQTELLKTKLFELVWVTPDALQRWTGRRSWDSKDALPPDFFPKLREKLACEGVLFCRLSRYHPYPPLVIGWNLKLIEVTQVKTLWAVDEIFDAGEPTVSNSARRYEQQHQKGGPYTDTPMILNSPQRFGHYTAWTVLSTLQANERQTKSD
jgi:hypothetical protein